MYVFARANWFLLACVGAVAVAVGSNNSGVVEVDLLFPRNDTYAPTPFMPIVFTLQKPELAPFLVPHISYRVQDQNNMSETITSASYDMRGENISSSDPFFIYSGFDNFNIEGTWVLTWNVGWISCLAGSLNSPTLRDPFVYNTTSNFIIFTTENFTQKVDLVAATNNNNNCPENMGVAVNVTNTLRLLADARWRGSETCAVVASSTPTPDPCRVKIDSTAASSISHAVTSQVCKGKDPPHSCPPEAEDSESTTQRLAVGGVACLAAALGALGYIMM